jgi:hypothetical protein
VQGNLEEQEDSGVILIDPAELEKYMRQGWKQIGIRRDRGDKTFLKLKHG